MQENATIEFEPFHLNVRDESLWRQDERLSLRPKAFAVLSYLVRHAGELVTRDALFEAVWPESYVSDDTLTVCIRELRQVLGDQAQTPQYIETVRGRGYRFVAPVTVPSQNALPLDIDTAPSAPERSIMVAREQELATLHEQFSATLRGERKVVFIVGEAGIGKTTLVDAFVSQMESTADIWIGRGQCIEQYGAGEPYLPLLEALGRLGRGAQGGRLVEVLKQQAPSWFVHLPALMTSEESATLQMTAGSATRERMLRELAEAIEMLTAVSPLILILEDLHWSDVSTVEWLAYIARRRDPARLFVLGTYRSAEAIVHNHPVRTVTQELHQRGQASQIDLNYLTESSVTAYLTQRFGDPSVLRSSPHLLHQRTNGNPLFLVALVDDIVRQGGLANLELQGEHPGDSELAGLEVPDSLRHMIERQLEQLEPEAQTLLEAASVVGVEFAAGTVAAAVGDEVETIEAHCHRLARQELFVRVRDTDIWPDGTVAAQYGFRHALYQEVLYERVPVSRRVRWHGQIGRWLEAVYGPRARELAAELAEHFVRGRDPERAAQYLQDAGETAQHRSAHQEAIGHLKRSLALLAELPDTPERAEKELALLLALGPALNITRGDASSEVQQVYERAQLLCQQQGEVAQSLSVLRGLWSVYHGRLQFRQARDLGEEFLALAQSENNPEALVEAHYVLGTSLFYLGELPEARGHFEQGIERYRLHPDPFWKSRAEDPGVACLAFLVSTLGFLGYPDQARQQADEARHLAEDLNHPYSLAFAQYRAGLNALFYREAQAAQGLAEEVLKVAEPHGFPFYEALGMALKGGALVRQGQVDEGFALLRQGLNALTRTGTQPAPHWLVWQADLCGYAGRPADGLRLLEEASTNAETTGNFHALAELYRLQGEFLNVLSPERTDDIEASFRQAIVIARGQQAKILELRAAVSLSRLLQQMGKRNEARQELSESYCWFTEGFDTLDLQAAQELLSEL